MAEQGRNTNFVAVSLLGHGALAADATIWNQTIACRACALAASSRLFPSQPGILTAIQPQDALEASEQHFDFGAIVQDCSRIPWVR
jgi:hypothetical protein